MPFNLDTYDSTGRNLDTPEHKLQPIATTTTFTVTLVIDSTDPFSRAIVHERVMRAVNNLGTDVEVRINKITNTVESLDNLDF